MDDVVSLRSEVEVFNCWKIGVLGVHGGDEAPEKKTLEMTIMFTLLFLPVLHFRQLGHLFSQGISGPLLTWWLFVIWSQERWTMINIVRQNCTINKKNVIMGW